MTEDCPEKFGHRMCKTLDKIDFFSMFWLLGNVFQFFISIEFSPKFTTHLSSLLHFFYTLSVWSVWFSISKYCSAFRLLGLSFQHSKLCQYCCNNVGLFVHWNPGVQVIYPFPISLSLSLYRAMPLFCHFAHILFDLPVSTSNINDI